MSALRTLKILLAAVIGLFVIAASYISYLVVERQEALREVSRYNVVWLVSQASTELARLEQRLSAYGDPGSKVTEDEIQLRFDIMVNRLKLLGRGDVEEFLHRDPEHQATVRE